MQVAEIAKQTIVHFIPCSFVQQNLLLILMEIHDAKVTFFTLSGTINHMHIYPTILIVMLYILLVSSYDIKPVFKDRIKAFPRDNLNYQTVKCHYLFNYVHKIKK